MKKIAFWSKRICSMLVIFSLTASMIIAPLSIFSYLRMNADENQLLAGIAAEKITVGITNGCTRSLNEKIQFIEEKQICQYNAKKELPSEQDTCTFHRDLSFIGVDPHSWNGICEDFQYLHNFTEIGVNFFGLEFFGWHGIQPEERGPYEWAEFDEQVKAIENIGGEILFKIWSGSTWASTVHPILGLNGNRALPSSPIKEEYIEDFKAFVKAVVERYDGDGVKDMGWETPDDPSDDLQYPHLFYQFEGEPDTFYPSTDCTMENVKDWAWAHWCGTPKQYVELVSLFYESVKEENPDAVVFSPSTMFNDIFTRNYNSTVFDMIVNDSKNFRDEYKRNIFIRTLLNASENFDVVLIQGNKDYKGFLPWVTWIRKQVPDKEIWFADAMTGYLFNNHKHSHFEYAQEELLEIALRNGDSQAIDELDAFETYDDLLDWALGLQAEYVMKKAVAAAAAGVRHIFFQWPLESQDPITGWVNVGLMEDNIPQSRFVTGTRRPAFYSIQLFNEYLNGFDSVMDLNPLPLGVDPIKWTWCVQFTRDGEDIFVLWMDDPVNTSGTYDLSQVLEGEYVHVIHIVTELDENGNPVYLPNELVPTSSIPLTKTPIIVKSNRSPSRPTIRGPRFGKTERQQEYSFVATDPDKDEIYYFVDWGDNTTSGWVGPCDSGGKISLAHMWTSRGRYTLKAKAKDIYGAESDWATLEVRMPKNNFWFFPWFLVVAEETNIFL